MNKGHHCCVHTHEGHALWEKVTGDLRGIMHAKRKQGIVTSLRESLLGQDCGQRLRREKGKSFSSGEHSIADGVQRI